MRLKVLSYNIHKGVSSLGLDSTLEEIKKQIVATGCNLICLQEVAGPHEGQTQFEYLADQAWPHYSYGKNAVYKDGHHGNAILTEFPVASWLNTDISTNRFESRGLLWCRIQPPFLVEPIHVVTLHLNLLEKDRFLQVDKLIQKISAQIPMDAPLIVAGDFNDWTGNACRRLESDLHMTEAFSKLNGNFARTYPSYFPLLRLDRVYVRHLHLISAKVLVGPVWNSLSDHLPLYVELEIKNG